MTKEHLDLKEIDAYKRSFNLSNYIWRLIANWEHFERDSIGKGLIKAVDSISSNIAEGYNKSHRKKSIQCYHFSMSYVEQCRDWIRKAILRKLITQEEYFFMIKELREIPKEIHALIKFASRKLKL